MIIEGFGAITKRDTLGKISADSMLQLGGHSVPRALLFPSTGPGVGQGLRFGMAKEALPVVEKTVISDLLIDNGHVLGAAGYQARTGEIIVIRAKQTILATGGGGWLYYPHTDTSQTATADGFSLALNAGAELVDMEQVQFIPFSLTHPAGVVGCIVGEPFTAGPCGTLTNRHGHEILSNVATKTRSQVSNAIILEVENGNGTQYGGCLLDLQANKSNEKGKILYHHYRKGIFKPFTDLINAAYGAKAAAWEEPWDVYPTAHYSMGGIAINEWGEASGVKNLFACGEVTGGVHGGNRLGAVSMTELFVFGKRAGQRAAANANSSVSCAPAREITEQPVQRLIDLIGKQGRHRIIDLKRQLQKTMWQASGPVRDEKRLKDGLSAIALIEDHYREATISNARVYNTELMDAIELKLMLAAAKAITVSALERKESRGAHVRRDHPNRDDATWLRNIFVKNDGDGGLALKTRPVELKYMKPRGVNGKLKAV